MTDRELRKRLGHNGVECRVRIKRDGTVLRHGSPNETDRSMDYWQYIGKAEVLKRTLAREDGEG